MKFKKYLLAVFIIFSLSFSYQLVNFYRKENEPVILVLNYDKDLLTNEFINKNETRKFLLLVSLSFKCMIYDSEKNFLNTS